MITKVSHTSLFVSDQGKAYDFNVNTLGFRVHTDVSMENGFRWLTVTPPEQPDLEIPLISPSDGMMKYDEEAKNAFEILLDKGAMGAGVLDTPDCVTTYEELKTKGVVFKSAPKEQFYGIEAIMTDGVGKWFSMTQTKPTIPGSP
jgi:catechol 2,3-dioxygenase-like lactoylglutathione lyase family enzyme